MIKASSPLVGSPDEVIDHLRAYEAAGVGEVVVMLAGKVDPQSGEIVIVESKQAKRRR